MSPQERQMIDELFDRLATLENTPRDGDAEAAIIAGLRRAPNAAYALVQTVLVQDEALRRANDRIEELEGRELAQAPAGGFLDSMRGALFGGAEATRPQSSMQGSVPNVQPADANSRPRWNSGEVLGRSETPADDPRAAFRADPRANAAPGGGSTFLGTAAAAAAGMIGGSLLMNSIRGLTGGGQPQSPGSALSGASGGDKASPWSNDASNSDLARDAGLGDIGKSGGDAQKQAFGNTEPADERRDYASNETGDHADDDHDDGDYDDSGYDDDDDFDDGDFDDGDSDFA